MGTCSSSESGYTVTAKLVLYDGRLEEYPYPVKVSYVLQKNPAVFICNSDEMEFDDVVSAISEEEELIPGQLYFALPLNRIKQRIPPEEMAALAVKASLVLTGDKTGRHRKRSLRFLVDDGESRQSVYGDGERRRSRSNAGSGGGGDGAGRRRKRFTAKLNTILE